jgi:hypothetical protein
MARTNSNAPRSGGTLRSADVPDQTVSQVGKAASEVMKLRQSLEENMAAERTDEERQSLTEQAENAAVRPISAQGISVAEYNEIITATKSDPELEERVVTAYRLA